ncbi:hypothetical protein GCM10027048_28560 [Hymenobacter coalescens]
MSAKPLDIPTLLILLGIAGLCCVVDAVLATAYTMSTQPGAFAPWLVLYLFYSLMIGGCVYLLAWPLFQFLLYRFRQPNASLAALLGLSLGVVLVAAGLFTGRLLLTDWQTVLLVLSFVGAQSLYGWLCFRWIEAPHLRATQ